MRCFKRAGIRSNVAIYKNLSLMKGPLMRHSENDYIQAGYRYENAPTANAAIAIAQRMRNMLESETLPEQSEARRLIAIGIEEARKGK
jgi:hypothetical protein